jgi:uncharacterized linocin/CFP29 family protein
MPELQVSDVTAIYGGARPLRVNRRTGKVEIMTERGVIVNSLLTRDEWVLLDQTVVGAALPMLRAVNDLRAKGLIYPLGSIASLVSRWYTTSEVTAASVNMTGRGGSNRDLPETIENGVPVPVVFKEFEIDKRALLASRRMGDGLDVTALAAVTRVVAEQVNSLLINGSTVKLNGQALYGYRTQPNRNTSAASAFSGGGVWSTIANIIPTVAGAIGGLMADNHYGPFTIYLSTNQYNYATLTYYTDGSGETPYDRIKRMPLVADVLLEPGLPDGEQLYIDMVKDVVDWAEPQDMSGIQVLEWTSGDGLASMFKVMQVGAPRVKAHQDLKSGIMHVTGA